LATIKALTGQISHR